jgi:hypothetical protein
MSKGTKASSPMSSTNNGHYCKAPKANQSTFSTPQKMRKIIAMLQFGMQKIMMDW